MRPLVTLVLEAVMYWAWYIAMMITFIIPSIVLPEVTGIFELKLFPPVLCIGFIGIAIFLFILLIFLVNDDWEKAKNLCSLWKGPSFFAVAAFLVLTAALMIWAVFKEGIFIAIFLVFIPLYITVPYLTIGAFRLCQYHVAEIEGWVDMPHPELVRAILERHPKAEKHMNEAALKEAREGTAEEKK